MYTCIITAAEIHVRVCTYILLSTQKSRSVFIASRHFFPNVTPPRLKAVAHAHALPRGSVGPYSPADWLFADNPHLARRFLQPSPPFEKYNTKKSEGFYLCFQFFCNLFSRYIRDGKTYIVSYYVTRWPMYNVAR